MVGALRKHNRRPGAVELRSDVAGVAEVAAGALLERCKLPAGTSATAIAHHLGFRLEHTQKLPGSARASCIKGEPGTFELCGIIWLVAGQDRRDDEASIAHELGHTYGAEDHDGGWPQIEAACERFAEALLMPRAEFIASAESCRWSVDALSRKWRHAPRAAIEQRIRDVGGRAAHESEAA